MIDVTPLRQRDAPLIAALFNKTTSSLPFCWELDAKAFRAFILQDEGAPYAHIRHELEGCLVARTEEQVLGFAHCGIGYFEGESSEIRRGFLRFLITDPAAPSWMANLLLAAVHEYFEQRGISHITAFDIRTGYRCLLAGRGALPDNRLDLMEALGDAGYRICQRWLLYERMIHPYVRERLPQLVDLALQIESQSHNFSLHVAQKAEPVADLATRILPELSAHTGLPSASLEWLQVHEPFRRQGVARWLTLRALNELATRKIQRLVVHINHQDHAAQSLLLSLGFEELPLRAYSYEKVDKRRL